MCNMWECFPKVETYRAKGKCRLLYSSQHGGQVSRGNYVLLLNNDTIAEKSFVRSLVKGIRKHREHFPVRRK